MAGRHRKPPAWRRLLTAILRDKGAGRVAALRAEVAALRATVADLRAQLDEARAQLAAAPVMVAGPGPAPPRVVASAPPAPVASELRWLTMQLPLVRAALAEPVGAGAETQPADPVVEPAVALDLRADTATTAILLPESPLLDPRIDRAADLHTGEQQVAADAEPAADETVEQHGEAVA
jgi:hypothetical protein